MRFQRLDLLAYGPFTNHSLDLSSGHYGVHLIHGANEAGKSSTLRAILHFLYGIPAQTADDFVHDYKALRIGAVLAGPQGSRHLIRRKANSKTLLEGDNSTPADDNALRELLPVDSREAFERMFGLDLDRLRQGGEELRQGKGELGSLLFAAGTGIGNLLQVQRSLEEEAGALYKKSGKNALALQQLAQWKEAEERLRAASLAPAAYKQACADMDAARAELEQVTRRLDELRREQQRLERVQRLTPLLRQRQRLSAERQQCADAPLLAEDFALRHTQTLTALTNAESYRAEAERAVAHLQEQLTELPVDRALLARGEEIRQEYEQVGAHRKAAEDRAKRALDWEHLRREIDALRQDLRTDGAADWAEINTAFRASVHELLRQRGGLETQAEKAALTVRQRQTRVAALQRAEAQTADVPDTAALADAVHQAQADAGLEQRIAAVEQQLEACRTDLDGRLAGLRGWQGSWSELARLAAPLPAVVEAHAERWQERLRLSGECQRKLDDCTERWQQTEDRRLALTASRQVPALSELQRARQERDALWERLRGSNAPVAAADAARFSAALARADEIADRLRAEAESVATLLGLETDLAELRRQRDRCEESLAAALEREEAALAEWQALWAGTGVTPGSPAEMRQWLERRQQLVTDYRDLTRREAELTSLQFRRTQCVEALRQALEGVGERPVRGTLAALITQGAQTLRRLEAQHERQEKIAAELAFEEEQARADQMERDRAQERLQDWQQRWQRVVRRLPLAADAPPEAARPVIDAVDALLQREREAAGLADRVAKIDRDYQQFTERVNALAAAVAPDLTGTPEQVAMALHQRLLAAQQQAKERDGLARQLTAQQERLAKLQAEVQRLQAQLQALCAEAGGLTPDRLGAAAQASVARRRCEQALGELDGRLLTEAPGRTLAELEAEVAAVPADELPGRRESLDDQVDTVNERRTALIQEIAVQEHRLQEAERREAAAEAAECAAAAKAALLPLAQQYRRLRVASVVLQQAVERYREQHQAPLLQRAGQLFARLTLEAFRDLKLDWDDRGEAALYAVRSGGALLAPEGMSEGTRDQLYLALRLASLERHCQLHGPVPLIADDILVAFDDRRAAAALQVLGELSRTTQVLLFTHHEHLVELAQEQLDSDVLFVHDLGAGVAVGAS